MLFNFALGTYCFSCKKYINPHTEIFLNILYEGSITCDKDHLIGNVWDNCWLEYWRENYD